MYRLGEKEDVSYAFEKIGRAFAGFVLCRVRLLLRSFSGSEKRGIRSAGRTQSHGSQYRPPVYGLRRNDERIGRLRFGRNRGNEPPDVFPPEL